MITFFRCVACELILLREKKFSSSMSDTFDVILIKPQKI